MGRKRKKRPKGESRCESEGGKMLLREEKIDGRKERRDEIK